MRTGQSDSIAKTGVERVLVGGLLLIILTPLVFDPQVEYGFRVPRYIYFSSLTILLSIVVYKVRKSIQGIRYNSLSLCYLLFLGSLGIAQVAAYDRAMSLYSTFERMEGLLYYLVLMLFLVILSTIRFSPTDWIRLFTAWVVVAVVVALGGLLLEVEADNEYRIASSLGNASYLSHYLLSSIILLGLLADASAFKRYYLLFITALVILLAGLFFTFTRTTYIGLLLGGLTFVLLQWKQLRASSIPRDKRVAVLAVALVVLAGCFGVYYFERLAYAVINTSTLQDRLRLWRIAWQGIGQRPLWGWGIDNFPYVYEKYMRESMALQRVWYDRSHNVFLDWFINGGVLSGLSYLTIWGGLLWYIHKTHLPRFRKSLLTAWWVVSVLYLFFNIDNLPNWILLILVTIYVLNHLPKQQVRVVSAPKAIRIITGAGLGAGLCVAYLSLVPTTNGYLVVRQYTFSDSPEERLALTSYMLDRAFPSNYNLAKSVADYTYTVLESPTSEGLGKAYSTTAYRFIKAETARRPPSEYLLLKRADLETLLGKEEEAITTLKEVVQVNPGFATAYLRIGYLYFGKKQHREAIGYFSKAGKISPSLTEASLMKIRARALLDADFDFVGELKKFPGEKLVDHAHLVSTIFRESGRMEEYLVWMWKGAYHTDAPLKPQVLYEWARCSYEVGNLGSLKNVLEIYSITFHCSPQFSEEVLALAQKGVDPSAKLLEYRAYMEK
ncbi:O-antigen ligase family protein [Telluribacter sp. SYSU D00476]|uniref:O-antigen ligase family protein n=1 Tax=Telluribacter sp. SYSU D00476 TaxID=2811430 RepID=UPI001FF16099|nr:O-antigen ligase family protein [Telluribacter sp. SYSU D00476]